MDSTKMRSTRRVLPALVLALAAAACHRGGGGAGGMAEEDSARANPAEVYGVSAARNVVVTPVEIEVPDLP
ncbi:MAG TPA: hypothetical protein VF771_04275, partial [Longimicrobiaceae bacterium]